MFHEQVPYLNPGTPVCELVFPGEGDQPHLVLAQELPQPWIPIQLVCSAGRDQTMGIREHRRSLTKIRQYHVLFLFKTQVAIIKH
jgi:hypothetical protein